MKKIIVSILIVLILIAGLFVLTGCGNNTNSNDSLENVTSNIENEITTTISCYNEGYLFKSKKYVEHVFYLNKDNKLIKYEHIEKYFEFTDDDNYKMISEGAYDEAELNNRTYKYLNETVEVNNDLKEVTITDLYDISKLESKNKLPTDELKENLNDDYILDLENYKNVMTNKQYTFVEK